MAYIKRQYPLLSACGLNCGLCPRYHTDGLSRCPGCSGEDFPAKHPACGVLSCCQRHNLEYCYLCDEYPCGKYNGADAKDSFITHRNQLKDFEKIKQIGPDAYCAELDEKTEILKTLLKYYNDGRRKNFFCIAVNLLALRDVKDVMTQIANELQPNATVKEKSAAAARLFQTAADKRNISLKLRQ